MALCAVAEVAVHFESFRNVDLFHQGLYHLKCRLYREEKEKDLVTGKEVDRKLLAAPFNIFACTGPEEVQQQKNAKSSRTDHHMLIPAHIIEGQHTFSTRSFLIRYCEEEVIIDDVVQFRVEVLPEAWDKGVVMVLEVDLMFADLTQHGGADRFGESPVVDSTEFKSVSTGVFRLHGVEKGLHSFCPVVFDEYHFCTANLTVHASLVDYRFRVRPTAYLYTETESAQQDGSNASSTPAPPVAHTVVEMPLTLRSVHLGEPALTFSEWLFADCGLGTVEELLNRAETLFERHIKSLVTVFERESEWLESIYPRCLTRSYRDVLGDLTERSTLELPGAGDCSSSSKRFVAAEWRKSLLARVGKNFTVPALASTILLDLNCVASSVYEVWMKELNVINLACRELSTHLRIRWEEKIVEHWSLTVFRETVTGDIAEPEDKNIGLAHDAAAEKARRTIKAKSPEKVEDILLIPAMDLRPVLFVQRYLPKSMPRPEGPVTTEGPIACAPKDYRGAHLFVLVHGFQGNSFDMRLIKNNLSLLYPEAIFLCSNSNEENTEGDFSEMGIRLAQEVVNYICDWCPGGALGRLSFIAHSIGGLIVRSALPMLHEYRSKMFTFLTLSTPHVGYFLQNLSLFHVGLKVLQSWRQSQCLAQLSMADASEPKECFLHRLSQTKGFEFFENVVLVSCPSDQYSPFDSARVEIGAMLPNHSHKEVYCQMVRNLWENVKPERVFRFDVNFHIPEKNLDTFIGRAAHIQFLECQATMKLIIHNYSNLFR